MSIDHELSPERRDRLQAIRDGAHRVQTPGWLREALVDTLDMIDEMTAKRALARDAIDIITDLLARAREEAA